MIFLSLIEFSLLFVKLTIFASHYLKNSKFLDKHTYIHENYLCKTDISVIGTFLLVPKVVRLKEVLLNLQLLGDPKNVGLYEIGLRISGKKRRKFC